MSQKRHHRNEMWQLCDVVCIKCKETFLGKDTFQIWYRCRGGGGGARRGTLILISPDTIQWNIPFFEEATAGRGPESCNIGGNPETTKTAESDECVEVWTYSPYVAAEVSASGTRLATNWQLFQIANFFLLKIKGTLSQIKYGKYGSSHIFCQVWCWNFGQRGLDPP